MSSSLDRKLGSSGTRRQCNLSADEAGASILLRCLPARISGGVLDLGAGDGRLGIGAATRGANYVVLVEIDPDSAARARNRLHKSGVRGEVVCQDYFVSTPFISAALFALVLSNPPQLPTRGETWSVSDCGGYDGFDHFRAVVRIAGRCISAGGAIYLHVLGFLPISDRRAAVSLEKILGQQGFCRTEVVTSCATPLRPNGATMREVDHVLAMYGTDGFIVPGLTRAKDKDTAIRFGAPALLIRHVVRAVRKQSDAESDVAAKR